MKTKILLLFMAILLTLSFVCCGAGERRIDNMDLNSPQFTDYMVNKICEIVLKKLPKTDKRFIGTVKSTSGGEAVINLANDTPAVDITVANPNEIPIEVGDQVSVVADNGDMYNAFIEFRKGINLNTIYVDDATGVDSYGFDASGNQYGTQLAPYATLQYAVNRLPKNLNGRNIIILVDSVDSSEDVEIDDFHGGGGLTIASNDFTDKEVNTIDISHCSSTVTIQDFECTSRAVKAAIEVTNCTDVNIFDCTCVGETGNGGEGLLLNSSSAEVRQSTFTNNEVAIHSQGRSIIYSLSNTGSNIIYGLLASNASIIGKGSATQPTGGTANEFEQNGSVIR